MSFPICGCTTGRLAAMLIIVLVTLSAGCALTPPPSSTTASAAWTARQQTLAALKQWDSNGRIGVVNGQEGWHANFLWAQQDTGYRIDLIGPLGQGRVLIEGDEQTVHIQTQDGHSQTAPDPDTLVEQTIGTRLPVSGLRYWVRGLPAPGPTTQLQTDDSGRLIRLEQNGWVIEYSAYIPTSVLNLDLPERIVARRQDLSIKLVIEQWKL